MTPAVSDLSGLTIAFDLDGTLVDTAPDLIGVLNAILAEHSHPPLPLDEGRPMIGHGALALIRRGFAAAGVELSADETQRLFDRFIELYLTRIADESRPFPGVVETLDGLAARGAALVVCTNKRTVLSVALLGTLGLAGRFAAIVGPDAAGAAKPDPRHLIAAVEAAGGRIDRAVMVGDSKPDLDAARAAGAPVVMVSFGYTEIPAADLGADELVHSFKDLPAALGRLLPAPGKAIRPALSAIGDA